MTDATNGEAILPCPFCGGQPRSEFVGDSTPYGDCGYWAIECCIAHSHGDDEDEAAIKWNRRQPTASAGMVVVPRDVIDFLLGEGEIEGHAFGERHHALPGKFWWRSVLRDTMLAAHESQSPNADTTPDVSEPTDNVEGE